MGKPKNENELGRVVADLARKMAVELLALVRQQLLHEVSTITGASLSARGGRGKPRNINNGRCIVANCKDRHRGPRFRYLCERHYEAMPKKRQQAALQNYKRTTEDLHP